MPEDASAGVGRRKFLYTAVAGAIGGMAMRSGSWWASAPDFAARTDLTPDMALQELLAGNRRFAANQLTSIEHDLSILKQHTVEKQEPFAGVLSCADSRVPVELVFDQSIGQIFVARVAGNIVTPEIIASLEYAVAVLGIRTLLVLGHTNCGAVKAPLDCRCLPISRLTYEV